jgi:teichuronic acid biosynthesis glycosyltransferase TuaG
MEKTPKNKKFSIIIPVYKSEKYLKDTLDAIDDQDYKEYEKIIVVNKDNKEVIKTANKRKCVLVTIDEDKGAPYARNRGAEVATGDYLMFIDPDVYLNPGILKIYEEEFRKHPEVGFVYASYEIVTPPGSQPMIIAGRKFDRYHLTCNNFISGANPLKRELFHGQDESLKSLQDWDMWLTVTADGTKGHFIEEFIGFKTEAPRKGSISMDSAKNWIERRTTVREKHGIEDRDIAVISMGAPVHGLATAKILNADFYDHPIHKENKYKLVYLLGFYPTAAEAHMKSFIQNINKDCKRLLHWIGTDVYQMWHQTSYAGVSDLKKMFKKLKIKQWAEYQTTHDEMKAMGIKTDIVPLPCEKILDISPLPKEFSVGVYINPTQNMYYENEMYDIARAMPDIKFKFFGDKNKVGKVEENCEWVGWVDMDKFIDETSCLLRITVHDGLPLGPVQFLMKGRDVVTNVNLDYAYIINEKEGNKSKSQILKSIREIKEKNKLNTKASAHYRKLMNHDKFRKAVYEQK